MAGVARRLQEGPEGGLSDALSGKLTGLRRVWKESAIGL